MSRRDEQDSSSQNAFTPRFFHQLRERPSHPATPEADFAGPWRVTCLYGEGAPRWACVAAGEHRPRIAFEEPDLAYLAAAALAVTERPEQFQLEEDEAVGGAPGRIRLLHQGREVATAVFPIAPGCRLPADLTRLADLRLRPQALAHFLLAVPDDVLNRTGAILMDLLREARR